MDLKEFWTSFQRRYGLEIRRKCRAYSEFSKDSTAAYFNYKESCFFVPTSFQVHQRVPLFVGSKNEVELIEKFIAENDA